VASVQSAEGDLDAAFADNQESLTQSRAAEDNRRLTIALPTSASTSTRPGALGGHGAPSGGGHVSRQPWLPESVRRSAGEPGLADLIDADPGNADCYFLHGLDTRVRPPSPFPPPVRRRRTAQSIRCWSEWEIVGLLADGAAGAQIAAQLVLSVNTVRSHQDRIRDKTGARRRAELIRYAIQAGIDPVTPPS
jgi:DNA-binding CsgD family transcriptional regulator